MKNDIGINNRMRCEKLGSGKKRRKHKQKMNRDIKKSKGKLVRFDLQNSSRKYPGFSNKYCYGTNIHNLIYKDGFFKNVRFQASNITNCNLKNTVLKNVDFCNSNLKGTSFKGATLSNVMFINCKLKDADFDNVTFNNVFFIMTNTQVARNLVIQEGNRIMTKYPSNLACDSNGMEALMQLGKCDDIYKYHVLHISPTKINNWIVDMLFSKYGNNVNRAMVALLKRKNKRLFITVGNYMDFIESYLKIC